MKSSRALLDPTSEHSMVSTKATSTGNLRSLIKACDSLLKTFCSRDFPESQLKLGLMPLVFVRNAQLDVYPFRCKVYGAVHKFRI